MIYVRCRHSMCHVMCGCCGGLGLPSFLALRVWGLSDSWFANGTSCMDVCVDPLVGGVTLGSFRAAPYKFKSPRLALSVPSCAWRAAMRLSFSFNSAAAVAVWVASKDCSRSLSFRSSSRLFSSCSCWIWRRCSSRVEARPLVDTPAAAMAGAAGT